MNAPDEPGGLGPSVGPLPPALPGPGLDVEVAVVRREGSAGVPKRRKVKYDRWAHRRGEPRVFALLWTIYLMLATGLALASIGARGQVPVDVYRPVAQILLVTVGAGIVLVWPLVRLSQARPAQSGAWAAMTDYFVVVLPVQAIVWPQTWLTGWPLDVIGAIAVMLASWGLLTAGLLAWALGPGTGWEGRTRVAGSAVWMGVSIALVAGGPVVGQVLGGLGGPPEWVVMASPLTAIHALTGDLPVGSLGSSVTHGRWSMMLAPGLVGGAVWLAAWVREVWMGFRAG